MIPVEQVDHFDLDLGLRVSKRTELLIFALDIFICVGLAEFGFVATGVVYLLDFVMREVARLVIALCSGTELVTVYLEIWPSAIGLIVVIHTSFSLMVV